MSGILYIVATPIGNLGDMGSRAVEILKSVSLIAAEDTRHSKSLLQHFGINTNTCAYHEHNEEKQTNNLIEKLQNDESIALISDAGTPLINDPGFRLVSAAVALDIPVVPVPGPSAVITALSVAGLPTDRFVYEGYLPAKSGARKKKLSLLINEPRTLVFYETPHRIQDSIRDIATVFGETRRITLARELTKQFEQIVHGDINAIMQQIENDTIKQKGEFVIVIEGAEETVIDDAEILRIYQLLAEKMSPKDAVVLTANITGKNKNAVYEISLKH